MIDVVAKTLLAAAALAIVGAVAVTPTRPPDQRRIGALPPVDIVSPSHPETQSNEADLKRLETRVQSVEQTTARISGKLDLLLSEGVNAAARPRHKPSTVARH